jgi:membrane associated rhomboid family serine protease
MPSLGDTWVAPGEVVAVGTTGAVVAVGKIGTVVAVGTTGAVVADGTTAALLHPINNKPMNIEPNVRCIHFVIFIVLALFCTGGARV